MRKTGLAKGDKETACTNVLIRGRLQELTVFTWVALPPVHHPDTATSHIYIFVIDDNDGDDMRNLTNTEKKQE